MEPAAKRPRLPRSVWVLGFVSLLTDLSSEVYHSLLPAFITVTLGLPAVALGTIDGIAEATASFGKLASGRLSDRSMKRKPWIIAGYGLAALSKPLFALATTGLMVMVARFSDRVGKGIRGSPRDAMIADETPSEIRGRAFGLRQALDTVGAVIAPLAAMALMFAFAGDIRTVFWIAVIPAVASVVLIVVALREPEARSADGPSTTLFGGFRQLHPQTRRLLAVGFLFMLARFSESFLILRGMDLGLSPALSPLALALFSLAFLALAYPAGVLSDQMAPRNVLLAGIATLVAGDLVLAADFGLAGLAVGILLWGAHMALTQGIFARMVADSAPEHLRATSFGAFYFVTGIATLLASIGAGILWDREGPSATFVASAAIAAVAGAMLTLLPDEHSSPRA
ncbi:MAG TPA: MFS transporter [Sphingomicrobium sp.]|nr:MFS transporter [Sphingomicrobium sp.]